MHQPPTTNRQPPTTSLLARLHAKLGDFWWYSLLMFAALRCGDLINAVVGLWLVPKYVPQEDLGAVLPLTQFATTFGLPISILVLVFTKYLAQFKAKGELGKVKSLLRWFLGFVMVSSLLSIVIAKFTLPALFERIRIQDGSLSLLIIATGIIGTVAPVFNNALQGLKKFKTITFLNLIGAPIRLVSMLILLPIRALSGYMAGQLIPSIVAIITSTLSIRKDINGSIKSVPFWKDDGRAMLRYLWFCILWVAPTTVVGMIQSMIIRQRLPEVESAAFYMISRFAELAMYAGQTLAFVMFPIATEAQSTGKENVKLLYKMSFASVGCGFICAFLLYVFGGFVFNNLPLCQPYRPYVTAMALLATTYTMSQLVGNFSNYEMANNRFRWVWYLVPIAIIQSIILVCFTGYTFFYGILPKTFVDWMGSCHLADLRTMMYYFIVLNLIRIVCAAIDLRGTLRHIKLSQ